MRDKDGTAFRADFGDATRRHIGRNITDLRRARGMSKHELASRVKISLKHLDRIETGVGNVSINILIAIAAELSQEVGDLMPRRQTGEQQLLSVPLPDVGREMMRIQVAWKGRTGAATERPPS
jgi:transcriptional regulator with XRE-family HTH domain